MRENVDHAGALLAVLGNQYHRRAGSVKRFKGFFILAGARQSPSRGYPHA